MLRFRAEITYDELEIRDDEEGSDVKLEYGAQLEVTLKRPDALRVSYHGDVMKREFWFDGEKASLLAPDENYYGQIEVSGTVDDALNKIEEKTGYSPPLSDLLYSNPRALLRPLLRSGSYVGLHTVQGTKCHHLLLNQDDADWQLWIDADRLLPRKIVITYKNLPMAPQFSAIWTDWDFDPHMPDELFSFQPPDGASRVEMVGSKIPGGGR